MDIANRSAVIILQSISDRPGAGVRDLARSLGMSTKTVVAATKSLERQGFITYDYVKAGRRGRRKKTAQLTKSGRDILRLFRVLDMRKKEPRSSSDLTSYYQLMGLDPLEAIGSLEEYYFSGLLALSDRTFDFIPKVRSVELIVDPSERGRTETIAKWFSDEYRFTYRFQSLDGADTDGVYEIKEMTCFEKPETVKINVATVEKALVDGLTDFAMDRELVTQAIYILLEDRYIDYDKLEWFATKRGEPAPSRIGLIFEYANQTLYPDSPQYWFPENFPTDMKLGEDNSFTDMMRGATARVFNLP